MLKALELVGFKSFADKTRFEFPPGITVVVGPNGSGKSNIVDAIKWVLGEQSAKSLRGAEMADVIFKGAGSGGGGRKPMNTAEATIVIDNSEGRLAIDAPEVHVSRRVYRSGEGEYLINRQPCRLKDIRDMFRGTGVGTDAYSLIEQGKVDRLLQASAKDRRAMFEEAAGISRFKAKKIEAQRRLERVDQNLLRLSDIVEEVESRLRNVRSQAAKARRYKEYSDRLQQLRTQVALTDWRHLTEKLEALENELQQLRDEAASLAAQAEAIEARSLELEVEINEAGEAIRQCESQFGRNRERIASHESTIEHERSRCHDLEEEESRHRQQLAAMSTRAGDLQQRLWEATDALEHAEADYREVTGRVADHERALSELTDRLNQLRAQNESRRNEYMTRMRAVATLGNQVSGHESQLAAAQATAERRRARSVELQAECETHATQLDELRGDESQQRRQRTCVGTGRIGKQA
jgi:chromosome segregation protein